MSRTLSTPQTGSRRARKTSPCPTDPTPRPGCQERQHLPRLGRPTPRQQPERLELPFRADPRAARPFDERDDGLDEDALAAAAAVGLGAFATELSCATVVLEEVDGRAGEVDVTLRDDLTRGSEILVAGDGFWSGNHGNAACQSVDDLHGTAGRTGDGSQQTARAPEQVVQVVEILVRPHALVGKRGRPATDEDELRAGADAADAWHDRLLQADESVAVRPGLCRPDPDDRIAAGRFGVDRR